MDENLGPIAISIRREKIASGEPDSTDGNSGSAQRHAHHSQHGHQPREQYLYRIIIRTSELATLRGTVLEEAIPSLKPAGPKGLSLREVLDMVSPEVHLPCLRLAIPGSTTEQQLLKLDQQGLSNHYKVGILYCKAGQSTEEEMYNNEDGGPAFDEFLDLIGQRVRLRGFDKYKAGLDNKMDSTGLYSVYSQYQGCELMFHVSSLLPFTPNNRQQLLRKRHIGNDIVTVVFQEPGALPFTPKNIRSQFQHVFIVVRALSPCSERAQYQVAVTRSKEVPVFGPPIPAGATFPKGRAFVDFLLAKIINAEHAAHRSEKFATMATRTRQEYLKVRARRYLIGQVNGPRSVVRAPSPLAEASSSPASFRSFTQSGENSVRLFCRPLGFSASRAKRGTEGKRGDFFHVSLCSGEITCQRIGPGRTRLPLRRFHARARPVPFRPSLLRRNGRPGVSRCTIDLLSNTNLTLRYFIHRVARNQDLATNYVTSNSLDSGSKFPILTFSSRKKERLKPKFFPDAVQAGAICWQVSVDDYSGGSGSVRQTDSLLGISADSLVLVEESTKECIWAVSTKAILGWTSSTSSIKLYYHQGEGDATSAASSRLSQGVTRF